MLAEYLKKLKENKNFDLKGLKIEYIKENDELYLIYFSEEIESYGRQLIYKIKKSTGETNVLFLPDEKNFELLDEFENNNFVNIPEEFRGLKF